MRIYMSVMNILKKTIFRDLRLYFLDWFFVSKICLLLPLKSWSARGPSHHPTFMGYCQTISYMFLVLSTQWMTSPSRKRGCGVSPRFHLFVFVFEVNQEKEEEGEFKMPLCNPSGKKLLLR